MSSRLIAGLLLFALFQGILGVTVRSNCECGNGNREEIDLRIINGVTAFPHQYPWIVYLTYHGKTYCGGAVLNDRYIITAGHCLYQMSPFNMAVVVGAHDSEKEDGISMRVLRLIPHENYTRYAAYDGNDIGLIRLTSRIQFNNRVVPICLPNPESDYSSARAVIAGWGTTEKGDMSRYLLHNSVRVLSDEECKRSNLIGPKFVPNENLCAYGYETDTCQGDSGSPLVYEGSPYKFELVGIVSWGEGCATPKIPGVYVKVTYYLPWIERHTRDAQYCKAY